MSETKVMSEAEAYQMKRDQAAESAVLGVKTWRYTDWPRTPQQAADYVNSTPAQGAGEAIFVMLPEFHVGVFYFL